MTESRRQFIQAAGQFLYGQEPGLKFADRLIRMLTDFKGVSSKWAETTHAGSDVVLITYGDMISDANTTPLETLARFANTHLARTVSAIHLLPFFPYSSDDGFSVIDYRNVDPQLGTWDDIRSLGGHFKLMFDGVINHVSAHSQWFQDFLKGDPVYQDWFIVAEGSPDLTQVVRPRALPLLTHVDTPSGDRAVWTTFSADQIDLNYQNPDVLLEMIDVLLFYVSQGAEFIRLDAATYLWKEIGTSCVHLPQTHCIIQLLRAVLDKVAPHVRLITETNVPHADNISYWGDGHNEAHLVYNFALPTLLMHTFRVGDASKLAEWAADLSLPSDKVAFFNFLASHDGIGVNPVRGILSDAEINALVEQAAAHGGRISYKANPGGSRSPYELNINYFDALSDPASNEPIDVQIDRFMAAQAIMLALAGMPGIYFHSLFGSRGWPEGVQLTGHNRAINRQKLNRAVLERELADGTSLRRRVFDRWTNLLKARASSSAFHTYGRQQVIDAGTSIFALARLSPLGDNYALCLHNISGESQTAELPESYTGKTLTEMLTHQSWNNPRSIRLAPYEVCWLQPES